VAEPKGLVPELRRHAPKARVDDGRVARDRDAHLSTARQSTRCQVQSQRGVGQIEGCCCVERRVEPFVAQHQATAAVSHRPQAAQEINLNFIIGFVNKLSNKTSIFFNSHLNIE
jgi:hypothetical protein